MTALSAMLFAGQARAAELIRVEDVTWGFDGSVVPNAFNPVSFEIFNDSIEPAVLPLRMLRTSSIEIVDVPIGATPANEPLFLAPQSSRRIQLYAYIQDQWSSFTLQWGGSARQQLLLSPQDNSVKIGPPATVALFNPEGLVRTGGFPMPRFNELFFPQSASGTTTLATVVLDHVPDWQEAQQQAFADWLAAGGTLHLLRQSDGEFPKFSGPLGVLNAPFEESRLHSGLIVRHGRQATGLDRAYVANVVMPRTAVQMTPREEPPPDAAGDYASYGMSYVDWNLANQMFSRLKQLTRPDHNWALIYLLAFAYLLVIFPGCWLLGRRRADYRLTYGVLLGAVVLFGTGFKLIGQRGYGEQTSLHAVAIATPLSGERLLFREWANLFVTSGNDYRIQHDGTGLIYSSGQSQEAVRGWVTNPPDGDFTVDVPPFSSRTIAAAGVLKTGGFVPEVLECIAAETLSGLRIRLAGTAPVGGSAFHAVYRNQAYPLQLDGETLVLGPGAQAVETLLHADQWGNDLYGGFFGDPDAARTDDIFTRNLLPLAAEALGIHGDETMKRNFIAADRVRILIFAEMPAELFPRIALAEAPEKLLAARREGRVLYVFDVAAREGAPALTADRVPAADEPAENAEAPGEPAAADAAGIDDADLPATGETSDDKQGQ